MELLGAVAGWGVKLVSNKHQGQDVMCSISTSTVASIQGELREPHCPVEHALGTHNIYDMIIQGETPTPSMEDSKDDCNSNSDSNSNSDGDAPNDANDGDASDESDTQLTNNTETDTAPRVSCHVLCSGCSIPRFLGRSGTLSIAPYHLIFALDNTETGKSEDVRIPLIGLDSMRYYDKGEKAGLTCSFLEVVAADFRYFLFEYSKCDMDDSYSAKNELEKSTSMELESIDNLWQKYLFHQAESQEMSTVLRFSQSFYSLCEKEYENARVISQKCRFDPLAEAKRMGLIPEAEDKDGDEDEKGKWRVSSFNKEFTHSPTYPPLVIVPKAVSDEELIESSKFRSHGRIPVLSWIHPKYQTVILRAGQPLSGFLRFRSPEDEKLVRESFRASDSSDSSSSSEYHYVVDARPQVNAMANAVASGGFENTDIYTDCRLYFLDIANIHVVKESFDKLRFACLTIDFLRDSEPGVSLSLSNVQSNSNSNGHLGWRKNVESSGWLQHIQSILNATNLVCHGLTVSKKSVLVHCTDGWDRTSQLVALAQLLLDPYSRTIEGFSVLVEKEFAAFGHKFFDRIAHSTSKSPVFIQFLDCVWQCWNQFPSKFEFNEQFLISLADLYQSGQFGNFLCNTSKERSELQIADTTLSIWEYFYRYLDMFKNSKYSDSEADSKAEAQSSERLYPNTSERHIELWKSYYLRWDKSFW